MSNIWWKIRFGFAWFLIIVGGLGLLRVLQALADFGNSPELLGYAVAECLKILLGILIRSRLLKTKPQVYAKAAA